MVAPGHPGDGFGHKKFGSWVCGQKIYTFGWVMERGEEVDGGLVVRKVVG